MVDNQILCWLLSGDPAIRWQATRDLPHAGGGDILAERKRIETEGWGAALLSHQGADGRWAGSLYAGKWVSTTYTMLLLKEYGMLPNPKTEAGCGQLLRGGIYNGEEIRFSKGQLLRDNGVTGIVLGILCHFGCQADEVHAVARHLARCQKGDGAWLYDDRPDAERYRFESTFAVLKGLLEYQKRFPENASEALRAQERGREFLLRHRLFRNVDDDEVINKKWLTLAYPSYWFYDILSALDYFRDAGARDVRLQEAMEVLLKKRNADGTWNLQGNHPGKTWFDMEEGGKPSRWNTLRCLRVLKWWESPDNKRN